ncbi:MAG: dihydrodipicolinate synthase family protein [Bryobacteraceae bacterium]|nr:dihydrodipicolinate synthase family protein [Bryobacteraceae bacterium]
MGAIELLKRGGAIPAHPLALDANRKLDERRQAALTRYYLAAGAIGVAVGVHTTQFAIRDAGLLKPVLELARREIPRDRVAIAGVLSIDDAELALDLGYDCALVRSPNVEFVRRVANLMPVMGFYLQPAVGGDVLPYEYWRELCGIENVVAIKIAPFNRYQTIDVIRAAQSKDIALYTGNDDAIVWDLESEWCVGGLLGHFAVWTQTAVRMVSEPWRFDPWHVTDSNAAFFDASNGFRGCIAGIHEVLRRQGLLEGIWCLDPEEGLSPGQSREIDRVYEAYPELNDDEFVAANLDAWLR